LCGAAAGVRTALAVALACTTACRSSATDGTDAPVLRIGFGIGETARRAGLSVWTDLLRAEALLTLGWDGRAEGRLADWWAWEDEGRTLRLTLKEGVRLHDGSVLKTDVVVSLLQQRALAPIKERRFGFAYITRVTSPEPTTILIQLSQPDVFLLTELLDLYVVRPDAPDIATGAFRIVDPEPQVELRRFTDYHGGVSPLGGVKILTYDTHRSAWAALMRGEVDAVQEVSRDSIEFMEHSSTVRTYSMLQPGYVAMVFNQRHAVLRHVEVRRALGEALDRPAILHRAMRGHGQVADGPIWPFHWAYVPSKARIGYDPDSARARLDRAGFRLPSAAREGELRKRFSFRCLVYDEDPLYERMALMVQRQLFDIGVEMVIELVGIDTFGPRAGSGDFDAFLFPANAGRAFDFTYRFWHSGIPAPLRMQNSGYSGADASLDRLRRSISDEDTRAAVADLARTFHEDAPAAFIAWLEITRAVDSRFTVGDQEGQDPFANIWQWRLATGPER
jgi:peptide/nickel transport system substrate-binding protein